MKNDVACRAPARVFPACAWLALAPLAAPAAQGVPQSIQHGGALECAPARIATGNFVCGPGDEFDLGGVRLAAGDLDGNLSPEVAALQGGRLVLFVNPDVGDDHVQVEGEALDLCAPLGQARFLFTTATGLASLQLEGAEVALASLAQDGAWKGARQLRASQDGTLYFLAADQRTLHLARPAGQGFSAPQVLFSASYDVRDFVLLDWNEAEGPELALLGGTGLQVRRGDGTLLLDRKALVAGDALAVVARAGARDGLAWVTRTPEGLSYLFHFRPEFGAASEGPLPLGGQRYDSMDGEDLDGDGDEDLVLGGRWSMGAPWLANRAGAAHLSAFSGIDGVFDLTLDGSPIQASGRVLCRDLFNARAADGSRRPALATLLVDPPGLRLVPQLDAAASRLGPQGTSQHFATLGLVTALLANGCLPSGPTPLALWSLVLGPDWPAAGATHVEAIVRVSPAPGLNPERVALHHSVTPVLPEGVPGTLVSFEGLEGPTDPEESNACYFVQLRPVQLDPGGQQLLEAWPWHVVAVSASCDGLAWLGTLAGAIPETAPIVADSCASILPCDFGIPNGPGLRGPVYIPSAAPQLRVPSSGPGVLPIVWPWNY